MDNDTPKGTPGCADTEPTAQAGDVLVEFVRQSNAIEGIMREPTAAEVAAHGALLGRDKLTVKDVAWFVGIIADAPLRTEHGMNVYVGKHIPPPGGPHIRTALRKLLREVSERWVDPWAAHVRYETLHPFMDGNGRSGRAIWLWQMGGPESLPPLHFLHAFYYQTLQHARLP